MNAEALPSAADRLDAILTGEHIVDGEPTAEQAAELVRRLAGAGTVARLDLVHGALLAAYRAGQAAEHTRMEQLAEHHAAAFTAAVAKAAQAQAERAARPWHLQ